MTDFPCGPRLLDAALAVLRNVDNTTPKPDGWLLLSVPADLWDALVLQAAQYIKERTPL